MLRKASSWDACLDEIQIKNLRVDCVVGIYPSEKNQVQGLDLDLKLFLDTREAVKSNSLTKSVDYAAICAEIAFILQNARFRLLETAAEALCHYLLAPAPVDRPRGAVSGVEVCLRKPDALKGQTVPSLKLRRHRSETLGHFEQWDMGEVYLIHSSSDCRLYRTSIPARDSGPYYKNEGHGRVAEMPLSKGLVLAGQKVGKGVGIEFPAGFVRRYHNGTELPRSLLCVAAGDVQLLREDLGDSAILCSQVPNLKKVPYYSSIEEGHHFY